MSCLTILGGKMHFVHRHTHIHTADQLLYLDHWSGWPVITENGSAETMYDEGVETWLFDSMAGYNSVVDHRSRRPVLSPVRSSVDRCHVWPHWVARCISFTDTHTYPQPTNCSTWTTEEVSKNIRHSSKRQIWKISIQDMEWFILDLWLACYYIKSHSLYQLAKISA